MMKIEDIIFTDGVIISYEDEVKTLRLIFSDYCENFLELLFLGVSSYKDFGFNGRTVEDYKIFKGSSENILELFDDEENYIFRVNFDTCKITLIKE